LFRPERQQTFWQLVELVLTVLVAQQFLLPHRWITVALQLLDIR
jgi:hypothetical protein